MQKYSLLFIGILVCSESLCALSAFKMKVMLTMHLWYYSSPIFSLLNRFIFKLDLTLECLNYLSNYPTMSVSTSRFHHEAINIKYNKFAGLSKGNKH